MDSIFRTRLMRAFRAGLILFGIALLFAASPSLAGHAVAGVGQNPQQPQFTATISGTITYCTNASPPAVTSATVNIVGPTTNFSPATNASGFYTQDVTESGIFTITPAPKTALPTGSAGIDAIDVLRTRQIALMSPAFVPTVCQQKASDVDASGTTDVLDVIDVRRFALSAASGFANTGQWRYEPTFNSVPVLGNTTQNFGGYVLGDIDGSVSPTGPIGQAKQTAPSSPLVESSVSLPVASISTPTVTNFNLTINVSDTTGQSYIGFQGDFTFDSSIVTFQATPVTNSGLTASGWSASGNVFIGPGQTGSMRTLRVIIDVNTPDGSSFLTGAGTLCRLNLTRVSTTVGASTPLTWIVGANGPRFVKCTQADCSGIVFAPSANPTNGSVTIGSAPNAVHLSSFKAAGYDNGVYLNWKTGFEAENLGFNIYREVAGKRTLVTPDLVAGSALRTGAATRLEAGQSYGWFDKSLGDQQDARYWLEEIDINGIRTMHGPFDVHRTGGNPPRESQAALLSQLGRGEPSTHQLALSYQPFHPDVRSAEFSAQATVNSSASTLKLASMQAVKMTIKEEGWYRVTQQELAAVGLDTKADPRRLQLYLDGVEQPMLVTGERDGGYGAVEFFATGQDTVSTDAHVYWLVNGDRAGKRVGFANGQSNGGGVRSFPYTAERRDRTVYFSSLKNGDADNFFGQVVTSDGVEQTVAVPHLDSASGGAAQVEIALQGAIDLEGSADHRVRVLLNGANLGWITFDGLSHTVQKFTVSPGILKDGDNVFSLAGEASNRDISLVDYIRVTYQHKYVSDQDVLRLTASGVQTIDGFSNGNIRVFDITDPASAVELAVNPGPSGDKYAVGLALSEGTRTLLALTDDRIKRPASITANQPSNLKNKKNKANFVIIARREFFPTLEPLRALRESQGLRVALVDIEDIYDEFSDGERTPQAVKDFLSFATTTWKKAPRFVLFAGHASLDPKNHLGLGDSDLVPTKLIDTDLMETAFDDWFTDFDGDGLAELATGRLPFRTADEAATMVSKIVSYESSATSSEALFVADANDGFDFEAASSQVRGLMPSGLKSSQINRGRVDADTARAQLVDAINRGQKVVNYIGHGSVDQWKGDLLTGEAARSLTNGGRLPLFVMMTCLNGYSHDAALDSLAESLLKAERGGAVAVWASSGMTSPVGQEVANRELYRQLFGQGQKPTLGEAVMRAKASVQDLDVRRTWVLLGDPTMRIK